MGCGGHWRLSQKPKFRFFVAFPNNQYQFIFRLGQKLLQVIKVLKIIKNTNVSLAEGVYNHTYQPAPGALAYRLQHLTARFI